MERIVRDKHGQGAGPLRTLTLTSLGVVVGNAVGAALGVADGCWVGLAVGLAVGAAEGAPVGDAEGCSVGASVGTSDGRAVDISVGDCVGGKTVMARARKPPPCALDTLSVGPKLMPDVAAPAIYTPPKASICRSATVSVLLPPKRAPDIGVPSNVKRSRKMSVLPALYTSAGWERFMWKLKVPVVLVVCMCVGV